MKKILLASTALVAFAGAAAAEVTGSGPGTINITGSAEMGIVGGSLDFEDGATGTTFDSTEPAQFFQDLNVDFNMSGSTDGGLSFGTSIDLDDAGDLSSELSDPDFSVFVSGDFGTVTLGDTDGAISAILDGAVDVGSPGSINDAETAHAGYLGDWLDGSGDGQIVRYDYTFDAFEFALSVEQMPSTSNGLVVDGDDDLTWALGFGYGFDFAGGSATVGLGYQYSDAGAITIGFGSESTVGDVNGDGDTDDDIEIDFGGTETSVVAIGGTVELDAGFEAGLTYSEYDIDGLDKKLRHTGIGVGYSFDAISLHANYGIYRQDNNEAQGYGIAAGYDLGGGASLLFGYGNSQFETTDLNGDGVGDDLSADQYSLGLSFSF